MNKTSETSKQKKQYFTFKDILLGLRQEYLRIENEFQALKECCSCEDNQINDCFYFRFGINRQGETDLIICYLDKEYTVFNNDNPQLNLLKMWNRYVWNFNNSNIINDNGNYKFEDINCPITINEANQQKFNLLIEKLLNDPFCRLVTQYISALDVNFDFDRGGDIEIDRLCMAVRGRYGKTSDIKITYIPYDGAMREQILIYREYSNITSEYIERIMNLVFGRADFNEYLQGLIDKAEPYDKQIIFDDDNIFQKSGQYEVREDGKKLVLTRWEPDNKYLAKYKKL